MTSPTKQITDRYVDRVTTKVRLYGWEYTVEHSGDFIFTISCRGRYPQTAPGMLGDDWIVEEIERYLRDPEGFTPAR